MDATYTFKANSHGDVADAYASIDAYAKAKVAGRDADTIFLVLNGAVLADNAAVRTWLSADGKRHVGGESIVWACKPPEVDFEAMLRCRARCVVKVMRGSVNDTWEFDAVVTTAGMSAAASGGLRQFYEMTEIDAGQG